MALSSLRVQSALGLQSSRLRANGYWKAVTAVSRCSRADVVAFLYLLSFGGQRRLGEDGVVAVRLQPLGQVHAQDRVALEGERRFRRASSSSLRIFLRSLPAGGDEIAEEEVVGVLVRVGIVRET